MTATELLDHLQTGRLSICSATTDHLVDLMKIFGDPEVTRFVPYKTWLSTDDAHAWLERVHALERAGSARQLVLVDRSSGRVLGTFQLFKYEQASQRIEIGYALARSAWGKGLMGEALTAVSHHLFAMREVRRIEAEVRSANVASCRLLEASGFKREGTARLRYTCKGETYDTHLYGLLSCDRHLFRA